MCLAIPGKITAIRPEVDPLLRMASVSFNGIVKDINLSMTPEAKIGDYVLVHVGVAIGVIDEEEALLTSRYLAQMGEMDELEPG
jgi:hydrogenase expression/formation protein HypC